MKTLSRKEIQRQATLAITANAWKGIIYVAPRVGKSKIVCDALIKSKSKKFLIIAPYNTILDSWTQEFEKWKIPTKNITLINQRSLTKEDLSKYDVVISDEVHTLSEVQVATLKEFSGNLLGLSGSISKDTEKMLREELNLLITFKFTIEQAIEAGIVADYEVFLIPVQLDGVDKYIEAGNKDKKFMTTELANYNYLTSEFEKFKRMAWNNKKFDVIKMQYASKRASLIYNSKSKIEAVKKIIAKHDRCLIFTARTEIADGLGSGYHSKSPATVLGDFMNGDTNKLAVCEMTNMGVTFPNLKVGIFHQLKSSEEAAIQKVMRMCNLEEDEVASIYITYYIGTVDEEWVKKALVGLNPDKIKTLVL